MKNVFVLSAIVLLFSCSLKKVQEANEIPIYSGDSLRHVLFPIGGFGTGNILLGGRGDIREFEIFNRAHKDELPPYMTFFSLWCKEDGEKPVKRILERELLNDFANGFGVPRQQLAGIPRFPEVIFKGQYPIAKITYKDSGVPLTISLEAYNPFIPLDVENSSIPIGVFNWTLKNNSGKKADASVCLCLSNMMKKLNYRNNAPKYNTVNAYVQKGGIKGVLLKNLIEDNQPDKGSMMCFVEDRFTTDIQTRWYHGGWWDDAHIFWNDFSDDGRLNPVIDSIVNTGGQGDVASILVSFSLAPGETITVPFYITWYLPNRIPEPSQAFGNNEAEGVQMKNYYALNYNDACDAALSFFKKKDMLEEKTKLFHTILGESTIPSYALDAVSANLAILKSNIFMRAVNGDVHAFEGLGDDFGCCPGNCTHVYNYAQTMASIFPSMERNIRETAYLRETFSNGYQCFRTPFPIGDYYFKSVAADGQMGNIIRVYREWKNSGDSLWLAKLWPHVKAALEFAWKGTDGMEKKVPWMKNCPVPWDANKEGMLRGDQHNTYDVNFFGPNMMTGSLYLGAIKACAEMAAYMGEVNKEKEYTELYEKGKKNYDELLWNGDYYVQKTEVVEGVHIPDKLKSPGSDMPKYQYGEGCLADQLLGQYLAFVSGMGYIIDKDKADKTLSSIFKYNFVPSFRGFENVQRIYALNDEAGLVICTWPKGNRELIPFPYADEVWTGTEYQVAASLIYAGMVNEGLEIVKAVRGRYAGYNRNPYAETESGYYYGRAMASWSVLLALSGFSYDGIAKSISFDPKINKDNFRTFWSCGTAWGSFSANKQKAVIRVVEGSLSIRKIIFPAGYKTVIYKGTDIKADCRESVIDLGMLLQVGKGQEIIIK